MRKIKKIITSAVLATIVIIIAIVACILPPRKLLPALRISEIEDGELRIHFLSVGQGDCTVVEFSDGELFVIDAGADSFQQKNKLVRYVKGLHPTKINLILTHSDLDHYIGFDVLLESFDIDAFYLPVLSSTSRSYITLMQKIKREGCKTDILTRYSTIQREGGYFVCLSPYSVGETIENDSATVLYLQYEGVKTVFSADIGKQREKQLEREYRLDSTLFNSGENTVELNGVDILKVAHHGSANSSSEEWINLLNPETAVISCGEGNMYSFPRQEVISNLTNVGATVYRTDELGDIIISIKDGRYNVAVRGE